jgi:hypothetical protein
MSASGSPFSGLNAQLRGLVGGGIRASEADHAVTLGLEPLGDRFHGVEGMREDDALLALALGGDLDSSDSLAWTRDGCRGSGAPRCS